MDYLKNINLHERDKYIEFDEPTHTYTIKGDSNYTSVTTWNHSHFEEFDADKIITNMMKSKNWQLGHKYYGMTPDQIKAAWDKNRDEAAAAGTKMHYNIECYYNNIEVEDDSIEYKYFQNYLKDFGHFKAYRTEWTVYDEELKLAGSIDMVYENDDGTLMIYDWKRSRSIEKANGWDKWANKECISHLPDTNYWHYSLQLNTYKALLEKNYNKKVTSLYLVCLHPNNKRGNYELFKVPDLQKEIANLFELRKICI
jgi:ATP-dependent exoDNAse (exonuclease V) beta subunit